MTNFKVIPRFLDFLSYKAHKFLETLGESLTVVAMRDRLRQIDLDFNRRVALVEYLTVRYGKNVDQVVNAPQGDNGNLFIIKTLLTK